MDEGTCIEIATGAPMPDGADAVVMVEDTNRDASAVVSVFAPVAPRQNIGRQGADIESGQTVLRAGDVLNASRVGALAALGIAEVDVYARPRVAILSTGNEIVEPGQRLQPGQIYDINKFTLSSIFAEHGAVPVLYRTAIDTIEDLSRAVDECLREDVLVFSGGSSVGERDLILDVDRGQGRGAVPRRLAEAGQAHGLRDHRRKADLRHARLSHVVPDERIHPAWSRRCAAWRDCHLTRCVP